MTKKRRYSREQAYDILSEVMYSGYDEDSESFVTEESKYARLLQSQLCGRKIGPLSAVNRINLMIGEVAY